MSSPEMHDFDAEAAELRKRLKKKQKANRKARSTPPEATLSLNSMMDMMTIILVFLLKSYGQEPIKVLPKTDLAFSTSEIMPKDMTVITITQESIVMMEQEIVKLEDRKVPKTDKKGGEGGLIIQTLETALRDEVEKQKNFARMTGSEFEGEMTIVADQGTPYRLIAEVMQTAIASEFKKFRFAVIKDVMVRSGLSAAAL